MKRLFKHLLFRFLIKIFFLLGKTLSKSSLERVANLLGGILSLIPWKRKTIAFNNLNIAFSTEYKEKEKKTLLNKFFNQLILTALEIAFIIKKSEKLTPWAEASGLEHLDNALKKGKGVIALSGHLGNIPLMIAWLAEKGYPVAVLYKEGRYISKNFLSNLIKSFGIYPIPFRSNREVTNEILKALNRGMIVFIFSDQSRPGVYAKFFGQYEQCQKGAFVISFRKNSPLVPIFIVREQKMQKIIVYPELKWNDNEINKKLSDRQIIPLVEKYNSLLENLIRQYPEQYFWFHRRFKKTKSH